VSKKEFQSHYNVRMDADFKAATITEGSEMPLLKFLQ
jgi:hypothetical protein